MAVEAQHHHHSVFVPSHLMANRDFIKANQANGNMYNSQMDSGMLLAAATMPENNHMPLYQSAICDQAKTSMNQAESGLTYNNIISAPRKRSRDSLMNEFNNFTVPQQKKLSSGLSSSFLDQDIAFQIQQQQSEIDRFIAQHTEKVRLELEEQRRQESRLLVSAIQERIVKKLQEKDDEIQRMSKLNWVLQERVKSLFVENQIWRDLAQSNEAAANSLRSNLEQVLAHVSEEGHQMGNFATAAAPEDDAESCCGSNDCGHETEADGGLVGCTDTVVGGGDRMCKRCGVRESKVLLLPCRHLCLCTMCGSTLQNCPVCDSVMNASVHVNFS
ncbi:E3 ubiquitin-protein ligase BOI [Rosa rugosa]|uniref:E3 ubiquitin-protein ligase BOI n=1 Tax=Rosa rugosa TaxID=74645 RepID=UPI002B412D98|nr:E3 ubiquitin-protein ligase BOI [Rosa rugosa]